jgi:hypothetical protein
MALNHFFAKNPAFFRFTDTFQTAKSFAADSLSRKARNLMPRMAFSQKVAHSSTITQNNGLDHVF